MKYKPIWRIRNDASLGGARRKNRKYTATGKRQHSYIALNKQLNMEITRVWKACDRQNWFASSNLALSASKRLVFSLFFIPKNIEGTIEKTVVFFEDSRHFQRLFNRTLRESFIYARTSACETDGERLFLGDRPHGSPQGPAGAAAPVGCDSMTSVLVLWHGKKWSMYF